ncbi:hypothetical protein JCM11641_007856, partial [Rhodosporidiobolus odoratus]
NQLSEHDESIALTIYTAFALEVVSTPLLPLSPDGIPVDGKLAGSAYRAGLFPGIDAVKASLDELYALVYGTEEELKNFNGIASRISNLHSAFNSSITRQVDRKAMGYFGLGAMDGAKPQFKRDVKVIAERFLPAETSRSYQGELFFHPAPQPGEKPALRNLFQLPAIWRLLPLILEAGIRPHRGGEAGFALPEADASYEERRDAAFGVLTLTVLA